jgi:hypothetical protein
MSFTVPSKDIHIPTPKKGDVVSFSYQGFARRNIPVGPIVFRIRTDVLWEDLVQSEGSDKFKSSGISIPSLSSYLTCSLHFPALLPLSFFSPPYLSSHPSLITDVFSALQPRHWSTQKMRKFFEKYANSSNSDPLLAQTWYNTSSETIRQLKVFILIFVFCFLFFFGAQILLINTYREEPQF